MECSTKYVLLMAFIQFTWNDSFRDEVKIRERITSEGYFGDDTDAMLEVLPQVVSDLVEYEL